MRVGPILDAARRRAYRQQVNAQALRAERGLQRVKSEMVRDDKPMFEMRRHIQDVALDARERNEAMQALSRQAGFQPARVKRQSGGGMYLPPAVGNVGFDEREDYRTELMKPSIGFLGGSTGGRDDSVATHVPGVQSYILPADVVANLGQSNSINGGKLLTQALFGGVGPYASHIPRDRGRASMFQGLPRPPAPFRENNSPTSRGGVPHGHGGGGLTPVSLSDGEFVVPAQVVMHHRSLGALPIWDRNPEHQKQALRKGFRILDAFVKRVRAHGIKEQKRLPKPAK